MRHIIVILLLAFTFMEVSAQETFKEDSVLLEEITVTAQQREQQVLDVPVTLSVISGQTLENTATRNLEQLSDFVPGLTIRIQTPHRPSLAIRGLTSDETSPTAQPRVSVYYNDVPTSRASMAVAELYDMERVEVMKGPQGTLYGRGSQIGAIHFITKKPTSGFGGYLSAGLGNYAMKEVEGAINIPVIEDKLTTRLAGIYSYQDGYVTNTSGGKLNGKKTIGGRFSATYKPLRNLKFDWVVNYQNDDNPGTAFMSKLYPNANGSKDIFDYETTLDAGKKWWNKREIFGTSLHAKYFINENNYLTSITSYYTNTVDHHYDGDGTLAPAIDMAEFVDANQFTQELRYNFSLGDRLTGYAGASYWREKVDYRFWFGPDEQYFGYLFPAMIGQPDLGAMLGFPPLIGDNGSLAPPMSAFPTSALGFPFDMPLPTGHEEENSSGAVNQAGDLFLDATYEILPRLSVTAGLRGTYEHFLTSREAHSIGSEPSGLGNVTGYAPNLFLAIAPYAEIKERFRSLTCRANLKYDISGSSNVFAGYAKGRRPNVLQFNTAGEHEVMNAENVHSFDAGFKWTAKQRYWFDAGVFYQLYSNFQTGKLINGQYLTDDAGNATSYGLEATAKAALLECLDVFGNYAYIHARFDDKDSDGNEQAYAGKTFRHTPENSFSIGLNARLKLSRNVQAVFTPTCSWRSRVWFDDANEAALSDPASARLEQAAYGLLNANLAFHFSKPTLTLSLFASNLTGEKYIIGAGNTGMMFGVPTYVPGAPRMFGAKLRWNF
ncbi:MAG: TonB-dependent receptor plug domain-containing protein [Tannerella sp.]|jgi:outer membrane receptor protein involved in Fe transport|nr:TonB-dependent receptor plug domain-containing protein [Tannerella sp.]